MIPKQSAEQLSTVLARWDGREPSDDDTLESTRRRPSLYRLTFRWRCGVWYRRYEWAFIPTGCAVLHLDEAA
jgi:hypothetical protein